MSKRPQEAWWIGSENDLVDKRVEVVWNRDVGKLYPGTVLEFNPAVKRHRVAFDDGDERWFRMERKIFTTELNGEKVTYRGEMKLRRDAAVASTMSAEEAAANKPKPKPKKAKKIDKSIINRAYMTGTMSTVGKKTVIEGWWDESKKVVQDPSKRDKQKTFKITKEREASLIPPHEEKPATEKAKDDNADDDDDDDEEEEEDYFSGGNYVGGFKAMTATGGDAYDEFEDDLMLHMKLDEDDDSDEEGAKEGEEEYMVKGMGCNSGGTYRVSGTAVQGGEVNLLREYITEEYFEEEKAKFNKFVSGDNGSDQSLVEFSLHDKLYLVPEDEPIKFLQANPRQPDTMVYLKYDQYKNAATIADALDKKCSRALLRDHLSRGWLSFPRAEKSKMPPSAVEQEN